MEEQDIADRHFKIGAADLVVIQRRDMGSTA
jgi:hypothetical protein